MSPQELIRSWSKFRTQPTDQYWDMVQVSGKLWQLVQILRMVLSFRLLQYICHGKAMCNHGSQAPLWFFCRVWQENPSSHFVYSPTQRAWIFCPWYLTINQGFKNFPGRIILFRMQMLAWICSLESLKEHGPTALLNETQSQCLGNVRRSDHAFKEHT